MPVKFLVVVYIFLWTQYLSKGQTELPQGDTQTPAALTSGRTVILYTYHDDDPAHKRSLQYFVSNGIIQRDDFDYIIIVQGHAQNAIELPELEYYNARYVYHEEGGCHPFISLKWLSTNSEQQKVQFDQYSYFIFVDCSYRGPFMPQWVVDSGENWVNLFTKRLKIDVKLVGSIIHCQMSDVKEHKVALPHVELSAAATDQLGFKEIMGNEGMQRCNAEKNEQNDYNVEASIAVMEAGFSFDTFMLRYQGLDWRNKSIWHCNNGLDPAVPGLYDGINLFPFEVLFVPVKQEKVEDIRYLSARAADLYSKYANTTFRLEHVYHNYYDSKLMQDMIQEEKVHFKHKKDCFDAQFYLDNNPDLMQAGSSSILDAWVHFINAGYEEGRAYQFKCDYAQSQQWSVLDPALVYSLKTCWDARYYTIHNRDALAQLGEKPTEEALWDHFSTKGYKYGMKFRLICNQKGQAVHEDSWLHQYEKCFDLNFYKQYNEDLKQYKDDELWDHFMYIGYIENRPFNIDCSNPAINPAFKGKKSPSKRAQVWEKWYKQ